MRRMDGVVYNKAAGTVDIGPGNLWDHVYGEVCFSCWGHLERYLRPPVIHSLTV